MRARSLLLVLLLAGCSGGGTTPAARPTPTVRPSVAPRVVVAVDRGRYGVQLFSVGADRRALPSTLLLPPHAGDAPADITLAGGATPTTCVVWTDPQSDGYGGNSLRCYGPADARGTTVEAEGAVVGVALRPDGAAIAWQQVLDEQGEDGDVVVASLDGRTTGTRTTYPTYRTSGRTVDTGCGNGVGALDWAGPRLLVQCGYENDFPGGLVLEEPDFIGGGRDVPGPAGPYTDFVDVGSATVSSALVLEEQHCEITCEDGKPARPGRAVRVAIPAGQVLEVIAVPADGRVIASVSGGPKGIVYVTRGNKGDLRVYLRLPGEKHGALITGLPTDVEGAVAQP